MGLSDSNEFVASRYDRLAAPYRLVEAAFGLPPGLRRRAVGRLELRPGEHVLEVGCGTGRNLDQLTAAVGVSGRVTGVDLSAGMLARAHDLVARSGWSGVELIRGDAAAALPDDLDGVLFSLSYSVLVDPETVLSRVWERMRSGAAIVILDAGLPPGAHGRILLPWARFLSRLTVLGDPTSRPWEDLAELAGTVKVERFAFGTYWLTRAMHP